MTIPTVSVIMAAYNGAALIGETIDSLIAQSFTDWELIVVDDCSPDNTVAVVRAIGDPRIRLIESMANGGPVLARNRAFAAAAGRYIAALDQDDLCHPDRLAKQVAYLDAHPEAVLVSTAAQFLIDGKVTPGNWPRPLTPGLIDWLMRLQNPIVWSSVMFRADAARRLIPFERPEMRYVEDFDFYHRIRRFGPLAQIDEELVQYRVHSGGASNQFNAVMREHAEILLGDYAPEIAPLLVRHVMARDPVPDAVTLEALFDGIARLRADFESDAETLVQVDREISRLWWRLFRTGVRSGRIAFHRGMAARPEAAARSDGNTADLLVSQMIGSVRAARRGLGGR